MSDTTKMGLGSIIRATGAITLALFYMIAVLGLIVWLFLAVGLILLVCGQIMLEKSSYYDWKDWCKFSNNLNKK